MSLGFVPNLFAAQSGPIPLSQLDANFAYVSTKAVSLADFSISTVGFNAALTAAKAALPGGGRILIPAGNWALSSQGSTPDGTAYLLQGEGNATVLTKAFNGDMFSLGALSELSDMRLQGAGASFTGRGIIISTGALNQTSWRRMRRLQIYDTASYGIEYSAAVSGYASLMSECRIVPTGGSTAAVKYPAAAETNGNRQMIACWSASNPLVDLAGSNDSMTTGCQGASPIFSSACQKAVVTGCRLVGSAFTMDGTSHSVVGNVMGAATYTFNATLFSSQFRGNVMATNAITDNAGGVLNGNFIDYQQITYTPTVTGSGGNPSNPGGTIGGAYERDGSHCRGNVLWVPNGSTTFGSGFYSISLPFTSSRTCTGSATLTTNNGGLRVYGCSFQINAGANVAVIYIGGSQTQFFGAAYPVTFQSGDSLYFDFDYAIQ